MLKRILGLAASSLVAFSASAADPPVIRGITFKPATVGAGAPVGTPIGTLDAQITGTTNKPTVKTYTDSTVCTLPASQPPAVVKLTKSLPAGNYACTFIAALSNAIGSPFLQTVLFNVQAAPPPPPDPTATISANPPSIPAGGKSTLIWSSQNAVSCVAFQDWAGQKALIGTESVSPSKDSVYGIDCQSSIGKHASATAPVKVTQLNVAGPLTHPPGSNYFVNSDGKSVYLTGPHTWNNLQNEGATFPPASFDYTGYLNWMQDNGFNFMRGWLVGEQPYSAGWLTSDWYTDPQPYARTGPGLAADGKPKFDLNTFNQAYFDLLRTRAIAAQQKGIYVSFMLFNGWSVEAKAAGWNPWKYHPFNAANNKNGINGDPANTGIGRATQTSPTPAAVLAAEQAYIRKVIDTLNDLDNVLWEVSNESDGSSVQWQYDVINYIKNYEAGKPKQHPVGMTVPYSGGDNSQVFNSPADWVSPNGGNGYGDNPPANNGSKVVLDDTDHIWGAGGDVTWVWMCFTRGNNCIFMDDLGQTGINLGGRTASFNPALYSVRLGMTETTKYAARLDLGAAKPNGGLSSTGYMLANPGVQYLAFAPNGGSFTVNLAAGTGSSFSAEWLNVQTGAVSAGTSVSGGSSAQAFTAPFSGPAALFLVNTGTVISDTTPTNTTIGAGEDTLVLKFGQDQYLGSATYMVWVDDVQYGGTFTAHALHSNPTKDVLTIKGSWPGGNHTVKVQMLEDRWGGDPTHDLNLYMEGATYNGVVVPGATLNLNRADPQTFVFIDAAGPPPPPPTGNVIPISNQSGAPVPKHPFQFGRPFVCGEIAHYPQVVFNGVPLQTQADVKNHCPDGSVKFAVISAVLPSLPIGKSQDLTFQDQPAGNNTVIAAADLLTQFPDFDAVETLTRPASLTGTFEPDIAKWQTITNGSLSLTIDGTAYNLTGLDLSQWSSIAYAYAYVLDVKTKAANLPATVVMTATQTIVTGGKTLSLGVPATGQDIGPLLFKSGVSTAGPSAPVSVSARKMLEDGNCKPWTSGPVVATYQCYDRSLSRVYDLDLTGKALRSFHPEFVLSFWLQTKQVFVRYVGEISNTMALEAFTADVNLTAGKANPTVVYQQAAVPLSVAARWTRTTWLGGPPEPKVNIDHNIGYLADANYLPNYDRTLKIPESVLADNYAVSGGWDKKISAAGGWMKYMPNTGYHPEIGHMPVWYNRALYSGDWRARQVMLEQADRAGEFPMLLREGNPAKRADRAQTVSALGLPITVYGRPWSWLLANRIPEPDTDHITVQSQSNILTALDLYGWSDLTLDTAHQPDPFFVPYLTTGDPFYLAGLQGLAGVNSYGTNPGYRNGPYDVIIDQIRGQAWILRTLLHAELASPDTDPLKVIYGDMLDDAFAFWEGKRGITGTKYQNTPPYKFAASTDDWQGMGPHPLGWWSYVGEGIGGGGWDCQSKDASTVVYDTSVCWSLNAPWQENFLIVELGRAVELGHAADKLFAYAGKNVIGQLATPGYNSRQIGLYNMPDTRKDPTSPTGFAYFTSWKDMMTAWSVTFRDRKDIDYWPWTGREFYWDVARGAAGMASSLPAAGTLPSGAVAWQNLNNLIATQTVQTGQAPDWNLDPTWAIVPRK